MVVKKYESELSCILAELFKMCMKETCFQDCWNVSSVFHVFKNARERSAAKNNNAESWKVLEKPVNNRLFDQHVKCGLLCEFQHSFRSSEIISTVSVRIARTFNSC